MKADRLISSFDVMEIRAAAGDLKAARSRLRKAGATKAARYLSRALKSIEGAERHALCRTGRFIGGTHA
jgi:carbohydrate-selective porin OprB